MVCGSDFGKPGWEFWPLEKLSLQFATENATFAPRWQKWQKWQNGGKLGAKVDF
jgi:hypothetical protein